MLPYQHASMMPAHHALFDAAALTLQLQPVLRCSPAAVAAASTSRPGSLSPEHVSTCINKHTRHTPTCACQHNGWFSSCPSIRAPLQPLEAFRGHLMPSGLKPGRGVAEPPSLLTPSLSLTWNWKMPP